MITEGTPLDNPYWAYSRVKIAAERLLQAAGRDQGLPYTIVRPSHTYGRGWLPLACGSSDFTIAARMLAGREIIVHGDGQSLSRGDLVGAAFGRDAVPGCRPIVKIPRDPIAAAGRSHGRRPANLRGDHSSGPPSSTARGT